MVTIQLRQLDVPPGQRLLLHDISWAEFEKRVYCSSEDASLLVGIPDVAVATGRSAVSPTGTTAIKWVDRYEEIPKLQVFDSSTEIARKKSVTE